MVPIIDDELTYQKKIIDDEFIIEKKKMMNLMVYITSLIQSFRLTFKVGTTWKNNFNLKCTNNLWKGESWELSASASSNMYLRKCKLGV